jgi:PAS domain S-box-containing protein
MERYREELTRIRNLLHGHPRGLTVTEIARRIGVNRNSVAKYLDVLITSGHVEKKAVGPAKVYFLSPRVPVSALLNLSSDYIIMVDEKRKIWHVNNSVLSFEGRTREEVLGRDLDEASLLLLMDPEIRRHLSQVPAEREYSTELDVKKAEDVHHFRATLIGTVLEDGSRGTTVILEDITEVKRHEESLRRSEEKFRSIAERSFDIIFLFDEEGRVTYISPSVEKVAGVPPERYIGTSFRDYITAEDLPAAIQAFERNRQGVPTESLLLRVKRPDGSVVTLETNAVPILKDGRFAGVQAVSRDITGRLQTEAALRESEEKFRNIAERAFDIVLLTDEDGRITYASPSVQQSTGYHPEEVIGEPYLEFISPADLPRATESFERVARGLPSQGVELKVRRKDGNFAVLEIRGTPVMREGRFGGVQVIMRDITSRKASEETLRQSEEKIRSLFEASADGICLVDEGGTIIEANRAVANICGIPREEAIGKPIWEIAHRMLVPEYLPPNFLEMMRSDFTQLTGTGRSPLLENGEFPIRHPDGTRRTIQIRNFLIPQEKGYRMGSIIRDITDRKSMEDDLKGLARNLGERVKEIRCLYSISRILSTPDLPLATLLQEVCDTLPSGMQTPELCGARIRMEGQEYRSPGFSETPWRLSQGFPGDGGFPGSIDVCYTSDTIGTAGTLFLEDERKLLEEVALRLAEKRLHHRTHEIRSRLAFIVESADDAIIGKDLDGRILSWNRGAERIYGYPAGEMVGKHISILQPPGYPEDVPSILEKIRRGERIENYETRRRRRDGVVIPVSLTVSPVRDATGRITGISTFARDISREKEARTALSEQVHLMQELLDRIPVPVFYKDTGGIYQGCNRAFEELSGLSRNRIIGRRTSDIWPSKMSDHYDTIDRQILASGEVHHDEVEYPVEGGEPRSLIFTRAPFYQADGSIRGIIGTMTEVTHLRKAEQALREREEQFGEMAEISPFPIAIIDEAGRYRYLNRKFTETFGYTLDDVPDGHRWFELAYPDPGDRSRAISAWKADLAAFSVGMVRPRQFRVRCRNGDFRDVLFRPVTMRDGNQFVTFQDMTDQIRTLDILTKSESLYRHLFNTMRCCFTLVEPILDPSGKPVDLSFREVNAALERLTSRPREVLVGRRLRELYPRTPEELIQTIATVALTGKARKLTLYHPDLDRHLSIRAYSPAKGQCALIFRTVTPGESSGKAL